MSHRGLIVDQTVGLSAPTRGLNARTNDRFNLLVTYFTPLLILPGPGIGITQTLLHSSTRVGTHYQPLAPVLPIRGLAFTS